MKIKDIQPGQEYLYARGQGEEHGRVHRVRAIEPGDMSRFVSITREKYEEEGGHHGLDGHDRTVDVFGEVGYGRSRSGGWGNPTPGKGYLCVWLDSTTGDIKRLSDGTPDVFFAHSRDIRKPWDQYVTEKAERDVREEAARVEREKERERRKAKQTEVANRIAALGFTLDKFAIDAYDNQKISGMRVSEWERLLNHLDSRANSTAKEDV